MPPSWRANKIVKKGIEVIETSILDGMTFESRAIKLIPDNGRVKEIYYGSGLRFVAKDGWIDPHVAYIKNTTPEKRVWKEISPNYNKESNYTKRVWQELGFLLSSNTDSVKQDSKGAYESIFPSVFKNIKNTEDDYFVVDVYALISEGATTQTITNKVKMIKERLSFPYDILQTKANENL